jgi:glyoxylase I family protein
MFTVKSIDHIVLRTNHIEKMIEFYCNILGGKIEKKQPIIGLTQIRMGEHLIDLVEVDSPLNLGNQNLDHLCFRIHPFDLEPIIKYFRHHNIKIHDQGIRDGSQGRGYSISIKDPEGNGIELREAKAFA